MRMNRRTFLGLAAAAAAHQATKGLSAETKLVPVNFDDIKIGQWADFFAIFEAAKESFYVGSIHPFFVADLIADKTIGPGLRKQLMSIPLSGGEAI